jgi:hypothetical protein
LRGNGVDGVVLKQTGDTLVHAELDIALRAERGVGSDGDAEGLAESHELLLGKVGVKFNLKDVGLNASIAKKVDQETTLEVATRTPLGHAGRMA